MLCDFPIWFSRFCVFQELDEKCDVGLTALRNICACDIHCSLQTLTVFSAGTWKKLLKTGVFSPSKLLYQFQIVSLAWLKRSSLNQIDTRLSLGLIVEKNLALEFIFSEKHGLLWSFDTSNWKLLRLLTNANSLCYKISVNASLPQWIR